MTDQVTGVFQTLKQGGGFLRDPDVSFQPLDDDPWVSNKLIQTYGLVEGATVTGTTRRGKKGQELAAVTTICGLTPEAFQARAKFERL
ncbi:MAG: hypothetical protein KDE58_03570, partial [Caldilineaceae bacterium]|nr:hypothetical protein [Caldilineaceae bacterium]